MVSALTFRRADGDDAGEVASLYLEARRAAVPAIPPAVHSDESIVAFVTSKVIPTFETWVAVEDHAIVGLLALHDDWIEQLYLLPGRTAQGIGSRLMTLAKERRPAGLQLWVFQSNVRAIAFYERHGFVAEESTDGDNEEGEPDVRMRWDPASTPGTPGNSGILRTDDR